MTKTRPAPAPQPLFIRRNQLKTVVGLAPSTVSRLEAAGLFPRRRRVGPGTVGWLYSEVKDFLEKQPQVGKGDHRHA